VRYYLRGNSLLNWHQTRFVPIIGCAEMRNNLRKNYTPIRR